MPRIEGLLGLTVLAVTACVFAQPLPAQTTVCVLGGGNDLALGVQRDIIRVVTAGDDTASVADRAMYNLPKTTASKVTTVTQTSSCNTAAQHFLASTNLTFAPTDTIRLVYIKVGSTRQLVSEVSIRSGPPGQIVVYDSKWNELANVAY